MHITVQPRRLTRQRASRMGCPLSSHPIRNQLTPTLNYRHVRQTEVRKSKILLPHSLTLCRGCEPRHWIRRGRGTRPRRDHSTVCLRVWRSRQVPAFGPGSEFDPGHGPHGPAFEGRPVGPPNGSGHGNLQAGSLRARSCLGLWAIFAMWCFEFPLSPSHLTSERQVFRYATKRDGLSTTPRRMAESIDDHRAHCSIGLPSPVWPVALLSAITIPHRVE